MKLLDYLQTEKDLTNLSSFHTKASAAYYFEVRDDLDLEILPRMIAYAKERNIPSICIGGGSNILFAFDRFEGLIIKSMLKGHSVQGQILTVASSELVSPLAIRLEKESGNQKLLPWIGLPGTFWGAVVGNAGCFGLSASDMVISLKVLDLRSWNILTFFSEELEYAYRHSLLKNDREYFVISADLDITPPIDPPIDARLLRRDKQPGGWSCGSFFKNPENESAGRLVDQAGLKGTRIGGIRVSEVHGNFFINDGTATFQEVLDLKNLVKETVFKRFNIELEEEVRIISQP